MRSMSSSDLQTPIVGVQAAASRKWVVSITVCALLASLYVALSVGIYSGLTQRAPGANDFYSRWAGARALFLDGQNPYTDQVTREIQIGMYSHPARSDEDQVAYAYPLYAAYLAAPLVVFPYPVAQAMWMALLVMGVVAGALALAFVNHLTLSPMTLAALVLSSLLFYPSVRGIFLGQYALVSFSLLALAGLLVATAHDSTAGIFLALSTVKPQPVILLVPVILFWASCNGRRQVVWSALLALALLVSSSFFLVPSWVGDFLGGLRKYAQYEPVGPPLETLFKLIAPGSPVTPLLLAASATLLIGVAVFVWRNRSQSWYQFQPTLGFAALVTTLIAGRIGTPDQMLLMIPWLTWLAAWGARQNRVRVVVSIVVLLLLPWAIFIGLLQGNQEAIVVTTVLPLITLAVFAGMILHALLKRQRA